jgi:hypothetical protein
MKLTEVLHELTAKGVSEEAVERILIAFRAESRVKRRNEYSRQWAREKRAQKAA